MEKLAFTLNTASRKLRHYFQAQVINVLTNHPLKKAMNKLEATRRLIQWTVKHSEFDVRNQPRSEIKAQALADFIAEFTPGQDELDVGSQRWIINVDGLSTLYAKGIRVILKSPEGDKLEYAARLQYQTTNNEAEYKALLKGLELAKSLRVESVWVKRDSQLVINQVNGMSEAKEDRMKRYLSKVKQLVQKFKEASFVQLPREENMKADALAKAASAGGIMDECDKIQYMPSIDLPEIQQIVGGENWMIPIIVYLKDGRLPEDKDKARKLRVRAAKYILIEKANGQAELANRSLLKIIKTRLKGAKGIWLDELPGVLWAYRMTVRTPTGETPFKLAYGSDAVILAKVHMANHQVIKYQEKENEEQLRFGLDLIDEVRMDAEQRTARYKNLMTRQHDAMVKPRLFNIGDLVLKRVSLATRNLAHGKLGPN
ncbi:uncharacterized protein LOC142616348 [Castanea sativa]|uniref:uncharacterized protein LOC142616348 n=1 Tax=Castanea sativa TaxID=21020 RepID=UPI003F65036F